MRRVLLVVACVLVVGGFATAARAQEGGAPTATTDEIALTAAPVSAGWDEQVDVDGDLFGVTWQGDRGAVFAVETLEDGAWTPAQELGIDDIGPNPNTREGRRVAATGRNATEPLWSGDANAVRVRVASGDPAAVELVAVTVDEPGADAPLDTAGLGAAGAGSLALAAATLGPAARRRRAVVVVVVAALAVAGLAISAVPADAAPKPPPPANFVGRGQWGAQPPVCSGGTFNKVRFGIVHHTAGSNNYGLFEGPSIVRGIQAFHLNNAYCDIAYNFLVDKYGFTYMGRAGSKRMHRPIFGAHTSGHNKGSFGVAVLGNYEVAGLPKTAKHSLADVLAWRFLRWGIDPHWFTNTKSAGGGSHWPAGTVVPIPTIVGHRDLNGTQCPGIHIYNKIPRKIPNATAQRM